MTVRKWEFGSGSSEVGSWNAEVGSWNAEVGSWTRRRPIGQDYAAAKDAEVGIIRLRISDCRFRIE